MSVWPRAITLYERGERTGDTTLLHRAVAAYRERFAKPVGNNGALAPAIFWSRLGEALDQLAVLEGKAEYLPEALKAYDYSLAIATRDKVPDYWATFQTKRAIALADLGRLSGQTEPAREAVAAVRSALEVRTRADDPVAWADSQRVLSTAPLELGRQSKDPKHLAEAVDASRAALAEVTRRDAPVVWALAQRSFGTALAELGAQEKRAGPLHDALAAYDTLAAYDAAQEVFTREDAPAAWAEIEADRARALVRVAELEGRPERRTEALAVVERTARAHAELAIPLPADLGRKAEELR